MGRITLHEGLRRGNLTLMRVVASRDGAVWRCQCDCGAIVDRIASQLRRSLAPSCGCRPARLSHGMYGTHLYRCYRNMLSRCYNPKVDRYPRYGGRGIRVCDDWRTRFEAFAEWAIAAGYRSDLSIDRINVDGDYSPANCRWVESIEQTRNRSITRRLDWGGKSLTVREWSDRLGVPYDAMQLRVTRGWTAERIFTQPFRGAA